MLETSMSVYNHRDRKTRGVSKEKRLLVNNVRHKEEKIKLLVLAIRKPIIVHSKAGSVA